MKRQQILLSATVLLVLATIVYWVWSGWGLITVDVTDKSLAEVIRSIEKQAGIVLKTNMDTARPVTMHVTKVPLTEALETLAERMDSRWRVGYFFGPDSGTVKGAVESISGGKRPEGWKNFDVPLFGRPGSLGDTAVRMDPRYDVWNVKPPEEKTLQAFLQAAATGVSASFSCPEAFNPSVGKVPPSGEIRKAAPKLAQAAGAQYQEVFLLMGRPAGVAESGRGRDDEDPGGRRFSGGGDRGRAPDFSLMRARQLAEIEKLPASEQPAARAEFDDREKFFASLRDLSSDERRTKMEEFFNSPENQNRNDDLRARSDERKSPEQRLQRYQQYVQKKQAAKQAATSKQ
jgi:hypothetical protein